MKIKVYILLITIIFIDFNIHAQNIKKVEIINADQTFADQEKHPNYWRLIGNISFKHNNAIMHCDSAYQFINQNKIEAFGNIRIKKGDSIMITGRKLIYDGLNSHATITKNVVLKDKYMQLKSQTILYDLKSNTASYPSKGVIIDTVKTIQSQKGTYYVDKNKFIFQDSVLVNGKDYKIITDNMHYNSSNMITYLFGPSYVISDSNTIYTELGEYNTKTDIANFNKNSFIKSSKYTLKGDSIYYTKRKKYGRAINNVQLIDTIDNIIILGEHAEYFEREEVIKITEFPVLKILAENDTLFMHAKKFISEQKEDKKRILAFPKVKFFKTDFKGKCDSISYDLEKSSINMFDKPILWSNNFQITADTIMFTIKNASIHKMLLNNKPMIIEEVDSIDYNQIKGKKMIGYFKNNKIHKMDILGNGQSIFIATDEEKKKVGINHIEATDLTLLFKENELENVIYDIKPISITTPVEKINEEKRYLKGFLWRKKEEPKKKSDIFIQ